MAGTEPNGGKCVGVEVFMFVAIGSLGKKGGKLLAWNCLYCLRQESGNFLA